MPARLWRFLPGLLLLAAGLTACERADRPASTLTPITVQFRWTHQAQFAGFYAADQNGYYAAEGLAVTFLAGIPKSDPFAPVLTKVAQFGVGRGDTLIPARASGKPVRAVASIYRRSPLVFFAMADSGISRPRDFVGKSIGHAASFSPVSLHTMMARVGIPPGRYTLREADVAALYSGEVQVYAGFLINEVLRAQKAGHRLTVIYPDDYGVHFYGDTLFSTDEFIATNRDTVRRFVGATLRGWIYAVENPTAVGSLVRKYAPDADITFETAQMTASLPLINTGEDHIGWMKPEVWAGMEKALRTQRVLPKPVDVTQVYTLEFLREMYGSPK